MNKQAMSVTRAQSAQSGFTLIELIVVIVILGILAATALPRFSNLSGDARVASLNAVRGAVASTSATAHGSWLINPGTAPLFEGKTVAMDAFGYPKADKDFMAAAGVTESDYVYVGGTGAKVDATPTAPAAAANSVSIVPKGIAGTATAVKCFVNYAQSTALNTPPIITAAPAASDCQ